MNSEAFSSPEGRRVVENIGHPVQGKQTAGRGVCLSESKKSLSDPEEGLDRLP
jgi:hypothetical protein